MTSYDERTPAQNRLLVLLSRFDTGMFTTCTTAGFLHARPMVVVKSDGDANLWFMTNLGSSKVNELMHEDRVCVSFQSEGEYLSLTGKARVVEDLEQIQRYWSEQLRPYFPDGPVDPALALICVTTQFAEWWDETRTNAARYALRAIGAAISGAPRPPGERSHHARLALDDATR